jgi:hypothetical protein
MPRPRKNQSSAKTLSAGQAAYVLERMLRERRVTQTDINGYLAEMGREISELEAKLQRLREAHGGAIAATVAGVATAAGAAAVVRRVRGRRRGRPGRPPAAAAQGATPTAAASKAAPRGRKRSAITKEQLASRQLQGRYLALVRRFGENKRAQYAKIAKDRGREAAIKEMQDALNKK